jgi:hypothetical protein
MRKCRWSCGRSTGNVSGICDPCWKAAEQSRKGSGGSLAEPTCIDLRPWAQTHRYRWRWEESRQQGEEDAFLVEVLCKNGLIYPFGGETLLAYAKAGVKKQLTEIPDTKHHQSDGNAEVFKFPVSRLDEVAAILKPRKRRVVVPSPKQLEALREGRKRLDSGQANGTRNSRKVTNEG